MSLNRHLTIKDEQINDKHTTHEDEHVLAQQGTVWDAIIV